MSADRLALAFAVALVLASGPASLSAQQQSGEDVEEEPWDDPWAEESKAAVEFHGFLEAGLGIRVQDDEAVGSQGTLQELRFRAELTRDFGSVHGSFAADVFRDALSRDELDYDLREALVAFSAGDADLRIGRQVLTWGTGDLVFLNDLFPKDWVSFFSGRETSYLKAPSDSFRLSLYKALNLDLVWTPVFASDRFLTGERFSFFSPASGRIVAAPPKVSPVEPVRTLENSELALRAYRDVGAKEIAFYAYRGFFKQPVGLDPVSGRPRFPRLSAWGASLRGPAWGGISNAEVVWYDSRDDRDGDDPLVPNSQARLLLGHERELRRNLTLGVQLYLEEIVEHRELIAALPPQQRPTAPEELRQVVTTRWTYRMRQDSLTVSLFVFFSPSDEDWFLMPTVGYRVSDHWRFDAGLNLFGGADRHTFFGQLEDDSNGYSRLRFSF